ncbi:MAG: recombination protein NinB [Alphaproteobacteria bacterium]|nr:recombination protein NinB [Alphaproteobacteria bacterium]
MDKRVFILAHEGARDNAAQFCREAPAGWKVTFSPATRNNEQNAKMHAMIGDISKQVQHVGRYWALDDMKRILVDEFAEEMRLAGTPLHHDGRVVPSMDGRRIVQLGCQTHEFYVGEASAFIEWLYMLGANHNVRWSEKFLYRE